MWKITKDKINEGESKGKVSSDFDDFEFEANKHYSFRLLDDDGEIYFYGEWDGLYGNESEAFSPLDEFGAAFGCTELQYKDGGSWETL